VNAILLLMALLILSYVGSFIVGSRAARGIGLASGAEYVVLGFVIGPHLLGAVERAMIQSFAPIAHVALGWLALVIGLDFGFAGRRSIRGRSAIFGVASALVTGGSVFGAVFFSFHFFLPNALTGIDRWLLAGGIAAASAETTRHAVLWVIERHGSKGPVADLLAEMSHADDVVPLLALAALFALAPKSDQLASHLPFAMPLFAWTSVGVWIGITVVLGFSLGAIAALLLTGPFHLHKTWGVLLGTSLLAIGVATRLQVAPLAVTFFMGMGMAMVSRHRLRLREAVGRTERPVLLPALLLAGAGIDLHAVRAAHWLAAVIAIALVSRVLGKLLFGEILRGVAPEVRPAGPFVGLGLLSSGALSVSIGLVLALRVPGVVGDTVLIAAAISAILGEMVAPVALRRALFRAGEIPEPKSHEPSKHAPVASATDHDPAATS
jgi:hypothetical protein